MPELQLLHCCEHSRLGCHALDSAHELAPLPLVLGPAAQREMAWVSAYCGEVNHIAAESGGVPIRMLEVVAAVMQGKQLPEHLNFCTETESTWFAPPVSVRLWALLAARTRHNGIEQALQELAQLQQARLGLGTTGWRSVLSADPLPSQECSANNVQGALDHLERCGAVSDWPPIGHHRSPIVPRMLLGYLTRCQAGAEAVGVVEKWCNSSQVKLDRALASVMVASWDRVGEQSKANRAYDRGLQAGQLTHVEQTASWWALDLHRVPHACARIALLRMLQDHNSASRVSTEGQLPINVAAAAAALVQQQQTGQQPTKGKAARQRRRRQRAREQQVKQNNPPEGVDTRPEWLVVNVGRGKHNGGVENELRQRVLQWLHDWGVEPTHKQSDKQIWDALPQRCYHSKMCVVHSGDV